MAANWLNDELDGDVFELLDDRTVEQLLAGRLDRERADLQALASFVTTLRSASGSVPSLVRPELLAIFETVAAHQVPRTSRRRRMLEALSAFVATLAGKVVIGTAAVAVSVGGAHAAGVVDVPGLPDRAPATIDAPTGDDAVDQSGSRPDVETGQPAGPG